MYWLINTLGIISETIILFIFLGQFLEWKDKNIFIHFIAHIFVFCVVFVGNLYTTNSVIMGVLSFATLSMTMLFFGNSLKYKFFVICGFMVLIMVSDTIVHALILITNNISASDIYNVTPSRELGIILSKPILLILSKFVGLFSQKYELPIYNKYKIALLTIPFSNIILILSMAVYFYHLNQMISIPMLISAVVIMYTNIMIFYLFDKILKNAEMENKYKLLQNQMNIQAEHNFISNDEYEKIRMFKHDSRNHFQVIYNLLKNNQIERSIKYIQSIGIINLSKIKFNTGNIVLDAIINDKHLQALENNIDFQCSATIPSSLKIDDADQCVIFGNLLDNAIEGCQNAPNEKYIKILLNYQKCSFLITIENSTGNTPDLTGNYIATTKEDKELHGIGLINVKNIVEKYNGNIEISCDNSIFKVEIMIFDIMDM